MNPLSQQAHTTTAQDTEETLVVFRVWGSEVIALFPADKEPGGLVNSYMHIAQHGAADYEHIIHESRPASEYEYEDLYAELVDRGYRLRVLKKKPIGL
jgi:hypothetical protein